MDQILKDGQLLIIRSTDNAPYGKYKSYAFKIGGDILAAVDSMKLVEMPEVEGEFEVVKGGNLHPRRYNPERHVFFSEQPKLMQEQFRTRNVIDPE
jgi:hypothetical protein